MVTDKRLLLYISINAYPHFIQNIPFDRNRIVCGNLIIIEPVRGTQLYIEYFIMYMLVKGTKNTGKKLKTDNIFAQNNALL